MSKHSRLPAPPPGRGRVATARTAAAPLTGALLGASAGTVDAVTRHRADPTGEGSGSVASFAGRATATGHATGRRNAGDVGALYGPANGITAGERATSAG
ncbi:hypothetical protein [Streptomyces sp. NPDC088785]|uniref:hypothetical protein n=1 Tax=Streptomyces sp. NPDC088785 TaxID=3365897 RepID=UPI0038235C79